MTQQLRDKLFFEFNVEPDAMNWAIFKYELSHDQQIVDMIEARTKEIEPIHELVMQAIAQQNVSEN